MEVICPNSSQHGTVIERKCFSPDQVEYLVGYSCRNGHWDPPVDICLYRKFVNLIPFYNLFVDATSSLHCYYLVLPLVVFHFYSTCSLHYFLAYIGITKRSVHPRRIRETITRTVEQSSNGNISSALKDIEVLVINSHYPGRLHREVIHIFQYSNSSNRTEKVKT